VPLCGWVGAYVFAGEQVRVCVNMIESECMHVQICVIIASVLCQLEFVLVPSGCVHVYVVVCAKRCLLSLSFSLSFSLCRVRAGAFFFSISLTHSLALAILFLRTLFVFLSLKSFPQL